MNRDFMNNLIEDEIETFSSGYMADCDNNAS